MDSLLKRGQIFLEDKNWSSADEYFDKVLDMDPECAMAYVGKFCAIMGYAQVDGLAEDTSQLPENAKSLLDKALRFAQPELRERLEQYLAGHEKKKQAEEEKKQAEVERRKKQAEAVRQARLQNVKKLSSIRERLKKASGVIVAGDNTVGMRADGTVVAVGWNEDGQCDVQDWRDIVAVVAGGVHTVGLRADGTVVAVGKNTDGRCNVQNWKLFNSLDTLEEERDQCRKARKTVLEKERNALQTELANLKGFFTGKRRKEIEARLAEIEAELKKL